jgi:hypothetical protein
VTTHGAPPTLTCLPAADPDPAPDLPGLSAVERTTPPPRLLCVSVTRPTSTTRSRTCSWSCTGASPTSRGARR